MKNGKRKKSEPLLLPQDSKRRFIPSQKLAIVMPL
jgi:hypothetical protein